MLELLLLYQSQVEEKRRFYLSLLLLGPSLTDPVLLHHLQQALPHLLTVFFSSHCLAGAGAGFLLLYQSQVEEERRPYLSLLLPGPSLTDPVLPHHLQQALPHLLIC